MLNRTFLTRVVSACLALVADAAQAQFLPAPVPGLPAVASGSVAWGDFDSDGRLDFLLSGYGGVTGAPELSLWHNTGNGFSNVTANAAPGLSGASDGTVAWGDFDNDSRLDFLITGLTNASSGQAIAQVWRNTGSGFTNVPVAGLSGVAESSAAWGDFDNDGRLDFFITGTTNGISSGALSQLWRNTGAGFTNVPIPGLPGAYFGSLALADFDNDGQLDFLITGITNSSLPDSQTTQLWRNTGSGFTNVPVPGLRGVYVSSVAWGDFDNDGFLDFLLEGLSGNTFITELWRNTGSGFIKVPVPGLPGFADGSLAWADFDSDGWLDFFVTGLTNGATEISQLWRNTGGGFVNVPIPVPGSFDNSLAWGDYDGDSRLDLLIVGTISGSNVPQLWRNTAVTTNSPPAAPTGLSSTLLATSVVLKWNAPIDDHTPPAGLSYNVRVGAAPGASDVVSASALGSGVLLLPRMGTAQSRMAILDHLSPGQTYYWSVQAVDTGFAGSSFAAEQQFSTAPLLVNPVHIADGVFQLDFTNRTTLNFDILASSDAALPLTNWTNLGPATSLGGSLYRFIDATSAGQPLRCYLLREQ